MGDVVVLDVETTVDIPAEKILQMALAAKLTDVVVVGYDDNGDLYFATSTAECGDNLLLFELAKAAMIENLKE